MGPHHPHRGCRDPVGISRRRRDALQVPELSRGQSQVPRVAARAAASHRDCVGEGCHISDGLGR